MVRPAAVLLVVVMLAASGRLLACGWECLDEVAAADASCHSTAPLVAIEDGPVHECPPEAIETPVTAAKKDSAGSLATDIAIAALAVVHPLIPPSSTAPRFAGTSQLASRSHVFSVLRI